jgi:hypothetical protein
MATHGIPWFTMVYNEIKFCYSMIFHGTTAFHCIPWNSMVPLHFIVFHGIPWYHCRPLQTIENHGMIFLANQNAGILANQNAGI